MRYYINVKDCVSRLYDTPGALHLVSGFVGPFLALRTCFCGPCLWIRRKCKCNCNITMTRIHAYKLTWSESRSIDNVEVSHDVIDLTESQHAGDVALLPVGWFLEPEQVCLRTCSRTGLL